MTFIGRFELINNKYCPVAYKIGRKNWIKNYLMSSWLWFTRKEFTYKMSVKWMFSWRTHKQDLCYNFSLIFSERNFMFLTPFIYFICNWKMNFLLQVYLAVGCNALGRYCASHSRAKHLRWQIGDSQVLEELKLSKQE